MHSETQIPWMSPQFRPNLGNSSDSFRSICNTQAVVEYPLAFFEPTLPGRRMAAGERITGAL